MVIEYVPSTMPIVMRSVMYTPGNNPRLLQRAPTLPADVVVLDLEDSVPPAEKVRARDMASDAIKAMAEGGRGVYVRVNAWDTGLTEGDLEAMVQPGLIGIVLPKTETPEDVTNLDKRLAGLEDKAGMQPGGVAIQLLIESAKGILNAYHCGIASKRVNSLVFGAVDYARDMRIPLTKEGTEIFHARCQVPISARAASLVAIDFPWTAFSDQEGFLRDTRLGATFGYEGRMLIHPSQIEPAHQAYSPPKEDVEHAREVTQVFEDGLKQGLASVSLRGSMVDWAVYRAARDVLAKADLIAETDKAKADR